MISASIPNASELILAASTARAWESTITRSGARPVALRSAPATRKPTRPQPQPMSRIRGADEPAPDAASSREATSASASPPGSQRRWQKQPGTLVNSISSPPGTLAFHRARKSRTRPGSSRIFASRSFLSRSRPQKSSSKRFGPSRWISCRRSSDSSPGMSFGPVLNFTRSHFPPPGGSGRWGAHTVLMWCVFSMAWRW